MFVTDCVGVPKSDVPELIRMIETAIPITIRTFRKRIGKTWYAMLEEMLDYHRLGLRLSGDYHVSFYRSKFKGQLVYYVCHSCIEYIFTKEE